MASFIVTTLAVNEENSEIANVEIGDGSIEPGREGPCKGHDKITAIKRRGCEYRFVFSRKGKEKLTGSWDAEKGPTNRT